MKFGMYYNKETIGDVLLVIYKSDVIPAYIEQRNDIVALFDKDNEIVGYNFLNISNSMKIIAANIPEEDKKTIVELLG